MKAALMIAGLCLLTGCGSNQLGVTPSPGGDDRADGIVTMSSITSLYHPLVADWREAEAAAARRCERWGFDGPHDYSGERTDCQAWDLHGRCVRSLTRRYYQCRG